MNNQFTERQHFISQAEQRFNSIDKNVNRKNQRIYEFEIVDREKNIIRLTNRSGIKIKRNLQMKHLFTFGESAELIQNMESLFHDFEDRITGIVKQLELKMLKQEASMPFYEIMNIWGLKLFNIFRNAYCIKKVLNMTPPSSQLYPMDSKMKAWYDQIGGMSENEFFKNLENINVDFEEYKAWLKSLLLLLLRNEKPRYKEIPFLNTLFGEIAYSLLTNTENVRAIYFIYIPEDFAGRFLLSDRSHTAQTYPDEKDMILDFNITDRIAMSFASYDTKQRKWQGLQGEKPEVFFDYVHYPEWAKNYNERTIYYAHSRVFSSTKEVLGAKVII